MPIQQSGGYGIPRLDLGVAFHEYDPGIDHFVADDVLPLLPVLREAATLSVVTRKNLGRVDTKHSNGAAANRINLNVKDLAYHCVDHTLEVQLTDRDRERYKYDFDAEMEHTLVLAKKVWIEHEIRVAQAVFNTAVWTGASLYSDNSAAPWATTTTDIIGQVLAAYNQVIINTGVVPNALIVNQKNFHNMANNAAIRNRFPYVSVVTLEMIQQNMAAIFGLEELIVGRAVYDANNEAQAFAGTPIWADNYAMVAKIQEGPLPVNPGLGRTMLWEALTPAYDIAPIWQYREEQTIADIFRIQQYLHEIVFDPYFGFLMKTG
jgi:hypothetical protein